MPHLFVNRPRRHNLFSDAPAGHEHFDWEAANSTLYLVGGFTFIAGSICFLPRYEEFADTGAWIFFGGSLIYLVVTVHDLLESMAYWRSRSTASIWDRLEFWAAVVYVAGTLLFIVGSVFFLSQFGFTTAGAWCFIVGSLLFTIGANINVLQIVQAGSIVTLQLLNATAVNFVVGSVLFLVASIPYLWYISEPQVERTLFTYAAWEYIVGSVLFFMGGIFSFYRGHQVMLHYRIQHAIHREKKQAEQ